ncbi:MAG: HTH-type transcriptional regulator CysL [Dehalococcoidia bacterium]|nr:HTH-type transcriptional regulator CysL [Bacillota bacterium]
MLNLRTRALAEIGQSPDAVREELTVAASSVPCQYLLPRTVAAFVRQFPAMSISLRQRNSHTACDDIFQYRCQLGVAGEKHLPDKLAYLILLKDELVIAVPYSEEFKPLLTKEKLTVAELSAYRLLLREPGSATRSLLERAMAKTGLVLQSYRHTVFDSQETIKQAVRQGLGVSVLSRRTDA